MGEMRVAGNPGTLVVPKHLDGACAASSGKRVGVYLLENVLVATSYVLASLIFAGAALGALGSLANGSAAGFGALLVSAFVPFLFLAAIAIINIVMVTTRGQTIGRHFLKTRIVKFEDGSQGGGKALLKFLLQGMVSTAPLFLGALIDSGQSSDYDYYYYSEPSSTFTLLFGIGGIVAWVVIAFATQDAANRHWFDRVCGVMTIDLTQGRDTADQHGQVPLASRAMPQGEKAVPGPDAVSSPPPPPPSPVPPAPPAPPSKPASTPPLQSDGFIDEVPWKRTSTEPSAVLPTVPVALPPPPPVGWLATNSSAAEPLATEFAGANSDVDETVVPSRSRPLQLTFDDGNTYVLAGSTVLGRDPRIDGGHADAAQLQIIDKDMSVSKTHLVLSLRAGAVLVEDLHSTNGTWVSTPDGTTSAVLPGTPALAMPGSTIHFGDRTLRVGA